MPILNINTSLIGEGGLKPKVVFIDTNDTLGTVTAAGYLNKAVQNGATFSEYDMALVSTKTSPSASSTQVAWLELSHSPSTGWSLTTTNTPGSVTLPTITDHIAVYTNTTGGLADDAPVAINGGSLQAGLSGTSGYLASFPATAARGSLRFVAANSSGDTVTTVTNASQAAARTFSIPDGGQSASSFLITDSAGTQSIATGSLALTLGNITAAAGNIAATLGSVAAGTTVTGGTGVTATTGNVTASAGNVVAGATAAAGTVTSFSGTGANEFLRLAAVNNAGGDFSTTISNAASVGQSQVMSIPDVGAATGQFNVVTGALVSGNLMVASGTDGKLADSAIASTALQLKAATKAGITADIGGAGAGPISVAVATLTASSPIVASIASSSNVVAVAKCIGTATGFDITFTADPGAACVVNYVAYVVAQ